MTDSARRNKRYPSKQELRVRCGSWAEFAQLYAADVSQGGMFIITDDAPPVLSDVEVVLRLPEGHEMQLKATVVHVLDPEQAELQGRPPGVGVQFAELDQVHKQQIYQLVEFARWDGSSEQPTASYASRMFEVSSALPPSKVLEALPAGTPGSSRNPPATPGGRSNRAAARRSNSPGAEGGGSVRAGADGESARSEPAQAEGTPAPTGRPLDVAKLKLGMTHLGHKRFGQAIKIFRQLSEESPADRRATQWLYVAQARAQIKDGDPDGAAEYYQKVLEVDESHHEARKFVREHHHRKRLRSLPFGRYFVKKR